MAGIDVSEDDFQHEVLERSEATTVVVDFWAPWCRPCRTFTPILEEAAAARSGTVVLAKVDTEANHRLAAHFNVHGVPAVKVFRRREVVAQFVGARAPGKVARFLDDLAPSEIDDLLAAGDETSLRRAVELDRRRADAAVALARLLHRRGEDDAALEALAPAAGSFTADALTARIRLAAAAGVGPGDDPGLAAGLAALDRGETATALDLLLTVAARSGDGAPDVRRLIVSELDRLGFGHPLTAELRRRLDAPARL